MTRRGGGSGVESASERKARVSRGEHPNPSIDIPLGLEGDIFFAHVSSITGKSTWEVLGRFVNLWAFSVLKQSPYVYAHCTDAVGDGAEALALKYGFLIRDEDGRLRLTGPRKNPRWLMRKARKVKQATYAIRRGGVGGPVKIGRAADVAARLASLQTACVEVLELIAVLKNDREAELHDALADHRIRGEWFDGSAEFLGKLQRLVGEA